MSARVQAPIGAPAQGTIPVPPPSGPECDEMFRRLVAAEADRQAREAPYVREPGAVGWWNITPELDLANLTAAGCGPLVRLVYFVERQALGPNRSHQQPRAAVAARAGVSMATVKRARTWIKRLGLLDYKRGGRGKPTLVVDPHPSLLDGRSQRPSNDLMDSHSAHLREESPKALSERGSCRKCGGTTDTDKRGRPFPLCKSCKFGTGETAERPAPERLVAAEAKRRELEAAFVRGEID